MNPSNATWKDTESGTQCTLDFNEEAMSIIIVGECSLEWESPTFITQEGSDEPDGVNGPEGEIYYIQGMDLGDNFVYLTSPTGV